jgi:hypothetical protein
MIRDAIGTEPHPNNMNRKEDFSLNSSWKPLIQTLKEWKNALSKVKRLTSIIFMASPTLMLLLLIFLVALEKGHYPFPLPCGPDVPIHPTVLLVVAHTMALYIGQVRNLLLLYFLSYIYVHF